MNLVNNLVIFSINGIKEYNANLEDSTNIAYDKDDPESIAYIIKILTWQYLGYSNVSGDGSDLLNNPEVMERYENLWNKSLQHITEQENETHIQINLPTEGSTIETNEEGKFGPFKITYPCYNGELLGDDLEIYINDKIITFTEGLPESGVEFYINAGDISLQENNTLKVIYKWTKYDNCKYTRWIAPRKIKCIFVCGNRDCSYTGIAPSYNKKIEFNNGYLDGSKIYLNKNDLNIFNNVICIYCKEKMEFNSVPEDPSKKNQDIIVVDPIYEQHEEEVSVNFLSGRQLTINLIKKDNAEIPNPISNINFDVYLDDDEEKYTTITTDEEGQATIQLTPNDTEIKVTLREQENSSYINCGDIIIDFIWDEDRKEWTWESNEDQNSNFTTVHTNNGDADIQLNVTNMAKITGIKMVKLNKSVIGERIPGVEFRVILQNARRLSDGLSRIDVVTDQNGEIQIGDIEVIDTNKDIIITLEETGVPLTGVNFNGLYPGGEVVIKIKHRQPGCDVSIFDIFGFEIEDDLADVNYNIDTNIVEIEIENEVTIDLNGKVWLDGQTGLKPVVGPNGVYDTSEKGIANIVVSAKKVLNNGSNGREELNDGFIQTTTDTKGNYSFKNLPISVTGSIHYYIEFTYDGINYKATEQNVGTNETIDSDVKEIGRTEFNNKFRNITRDSAISTNGDVTTLEYTYDKQSAELITTDKNNIVKEEFAMLATTKPTTYNKNTKNINMGLVKKGVDLAAVTDLYSANVSINGKTQTYMYNEIISMQDNITEATDNDKKYSLYLYNSDYNYRIYDYTDLPLLTNTAHPTLQQSKYSALLDKKQSDGELKVELTYRILLNNQSATDATINSIAYYYDPVYVLEGVTPTRVYFDGKTYNRVEIPINKTFTDTNNQIIYEITFTLAKDNLKSVELGESKTWVEIISYSTTEGCIDNDSAPDNILAHITEDDTDNAKGLETTVNNLDRTISGFVFEDTKSQKQGEYNTGDGLYYSPENQISDVIVQLIEVKEVTVGGAKQKLEYIWQETVSGSNTVKYVTNDGKNIATYNVSNNAGQYIFKDFIPGDYIVRFIYGDGTYYDMSTEQGKANILKYNGQDYKSTKDIYYNEMWHNSAYQQNASMARDNEARRLEEIGYATSVEDISKLIIDNKNELENTWICADTSLIYIPISDSQDSSKQLTRRINFGLVKRPNVSLGLEKHITTLKIEDVTEVVADINRYEQNTENFINFTHEQGEDVIATTTSKETNQRGSWIVQTDTSNVAGKRMDIEYTYIIKNIGDKDYIGLALQKELANGSSYNDLAQKVKVLSAQSQHAIGKYLGTAYYNGNVGQDIEVGLTFRIEDYLSKIDNIFLSETENNFTLVGDANKDIWASLSTPAKEDVNVIQTKDITLKAGKGYTLTLNTYNPSIDTTSGKKDFTYKSYAAQLVPTNGSKTTITGTLTTGAQLGNLGYVQANTLDVPVLDITPEADEFIAETVTITLDTGKDQKSPAMLVVITTGGLIVVAIGIVLIKKFVIK